MKKTIITIFVMFFITIMLSGVIAYSQYNQIVEKEERVNSAWSQIESNIQRKMDLIPNIVNVVKGYSKHEKELLTTITELRSMKFKNTKASSASLSQVKRINTEINKSLLEINAVVERYPDLKSSEQYLQLQAQIEGAENRINITRMNYNEEVKNYNTIIKKAPGNIIASQFGFIEKPYYKVTSTKKELDIKL